MNVIRHVNQLIALDDKALIESLYLTLLRRAPEKEGLDFYLAQLRSGHDKCALIADFASSPEARAVSHSLPGLAEFIKLHRSWKSSVARVIFGYRQRAAQLNRIENALARSRQELDDAVAHIRGRLAAIEGRLSLAADDALPTASATADPAADIDLSGVPLPARRIFRELMTAATDHQRRSI